jgi:hypothetical protein
MSNKKINPKINNSKRQKNVAANSFFNSYNKMLEFFVIVVLVFITYGNSINNDYNIDDAYVVSLDKSNQLTQKGIKGIPEILSSRYSEGEGTTYGYRPLGRVTMAIEYSLWGNNPHYSHFLNLLLFALNVYLLLLFIKKVAALVGYKNQQFIYLSILLFIIHPIHTEVVCSIKNREEILCFSFLLSSILIYFKFLEKKKWWYLLPFLILTFLAFLSKETAFNIFGIILLISIFRIFLFSDEWVKINVFFKQIITLRNVSIFLAAFICYFLFSRISLSLPTGDIGFHFEQIPYRFYPSSHCIPNGIQTFFFYIKRLIVPFPLLFYYGYDMLPLQNWNSISTIIGVIFFLIIFSVVLYCIFKKKELFLIFWILFFFSTIFPFSNFIHEFYVTGIVGERLVFQASVGFCIFLTWMLFKLSDICSNFISLTESVRGKLPYYISSLIVIPFLILTINRNSQWVNKETLYKHDMKYLSNSARANFMMAGSIMINVQNDNRPNSEKERNILEAVQYMKNAIKVYPKYDDAWLALGNIYSSYLSMHDSALIYFKKVDTTNNSVYSKTLESIGDIYNYDSSNVSMALNFYYRGINKFPRNRKLYYKITQTLYNNKMFDSMMTFADIGIKNGWEEGYINKGDALLNISDTDAAIKNYQKAVDMGFRNERLLRNMTYYYKSRGQLDKLNNLPQ